MAGKLLYKYSVQITFDRYIVTYIYNVQIFEENLSLFCANSFGINFLATCDNSCAVDAY